MRLSRRPRAHVALILVTGPLTSSCVAPEDPSVAATTDGGSVPITTSGTGGTDSDTASGDEGPGTEFEFVEDNGIDCDVGDVPAPGNDPNLPDPFVNFDGSRITTKAEWTCRRREIRKVLERYVYGVASYHHCVAPAFV